MSASIPFIDTSDAVTVNPNALLQDTNAAFAATFRMVVERIKRVRATSQVRVATSHGKDSTFLLNAALQAHIELVEAGAIDAEEPFICTNIDTRVDDIYVRAQIIHEVALLKDYCQRKGVNLRYMTATPPARYSWAVMYASGAKLPSFVKSSADCSVILKIDPAKRLERELYDEVGNNLVTLLGSRSDESARRAASIKKHSSSVDDVEINGGNDGKPLTCAPMHDLTDGDVFGVLRRMGEQPIVKTDHFIPSYAPHHKLIIKLYGDAQETCPVTSFEDAVVPKTGSCGASRFGCTLCLKVQKDKSATARSASAQYAAAANVLAIRDYLAHHAEDMSLREPLAKSVCSVTDTLVIQENTFNAPTLEKIIYWLCQATRDDRIRAETFRALVAQGRVDEDAGYQEIMNDSSLSDDDKQYFGDFYIEAHKRHMLQLIDLEQIMLICAIHARDGVKLPPFHALWIFNQVEQGHYIPYPTVQGEMKRDEVPNPRFANLSLPSTVKMHLGEVLIDTEFGCGSATPSKEHVPYQVGTLTSLDPVKRQLSHTFTKRRIMKKRRKGGMATGIERGRMAVQLPAVDDTPHLVKAFERPITIFKRQQSVTEHDAIRMLGMAASTSKLPGGMTIAGEESLYWFIEMELERILERHASFVANNGVYAFGGINPLQKMLSFGVLELTEKAMRATDLMLMRTDMLHQAGLFSCTPEQLTALSLDQAEYRTLKANTLLDIRKERNRKRRTARAKLTMLSSSPARYINTHVKRQLSELQATVELAVNDAMVYRIILDAKGDFGFDGLSMEQRMDDALMNIKALDAIFGSGKQLLKRLGLTNVDTLTRKAAAEIANSYNAMKVKALNDVVRDTGGLNVKPEQAATVGQMLLAHASGIERVVDVDDAKVVLGIQERTEFQDVFSGAKQRMITRLSFMQQAA